jgi:BON domain
LPQPPEIPPLQTLPDNPPQSPRPSDLGDGIGTAALRRTLQRDYAICAFVFVLSSAGALSGCALYNTYEKCGFHGCPGDAKITAEVRSKFYQNSFLEPYAIRVQTVDHVVYLDGVVSSGLEIGAAESIARKVPGVARVLNSIVVSNPR